jgi:hypothetical protein
MDRSVGVGVVVGCCGKEMLEAAVDEGKVVLC